MILYCTVPGLEANWIELDEIWTRRDEREIESKTSLDDFLGMLRTRATAVHLVATTGQVIDQVSDLKPTNLDDLDVRLDQFLGSAMQTAIMFQRRLGGFSGRPSSNGSGATSKPTPTPT